MVKITTFEGVKTSGRHLITLKSNVSKEGFIREHSLKTIYNYDVINAFAGRYDQVTLDTLCASEDVERISEDPATRLCAVHNDAPWGLSRLSSPGPIVLQAGQNAGGANFRYEYQGEAAAAGAGVDIYIVDSGLWLTHNEFARADGTRRAEFGATFYSQLENDPTPPPGPNGPDDHGHGTHCAGIAAGNQCGVAKGANVFSVKIQHNGIGFGLDTLAGVNWIHDRIVAAGAAKRPSVVSMSITLGVDYPDLTASIEALTNAKVHVVVASSDGRVVVPGDGVPANASNFSPGNAPTAITVGYTDINDNMVSDCYFGPSLDLFAPGVNIRSAWIGANNAYVNIGGTSMAAPHVAGLVAYRISRLGDIAPAAMKAAVVAAGTHSVLNISPQAAAANTTDVLAHH